MGGCRPIVVGDDRAEQSPGVPAGVAVWRMTLRCGFVLILVLVAALVDIGAVGVAASSHCNVGQCAGGGFAQNGVSSVRGDTLGGVNGDGVAVDDVCAGVVRVEHRTRSILETFGSEAISRCVNSCHPP